MKKLSCLIAVITAAIAGIVQAQTPPVAVIPAGLPARLSIGGMSEFLDGIATNQELAIDGLAGTTLLFQNVDFEWDNHCQKNYTDQELHFRSFSDFKSQVVTDTLALRSQVLADPTYGGGDVVVELEINVDGIFELEMGGDMGSISGVTSNAVEALEPPGQLTEFLLSVIPVANLVKLEIRVPDSSPPYTFIWSNGFGTTSPNLSPFPPEYTANFWVNHNDINVGADHVILNPWYCMGTNHTRITISNINGQATYTQTGDPIAPPILQMLGSSRLRVVSTTGANTTVESSPSPNGPWNVLTTLDGSTNDAIVDIPATGLSRQFFRAYSN